MNILFFSTMNGLPWGGSEELWYKTAKLALEQQHQVTVIYKYWGEQEHAKIKRLKALGAHIIYRDKPIYLSQEYKWYKKLRHSLKRYLNIVLPAKPDLVLETSYNEIMPKQTAVVCFSQGATFDLALSQKYLQLTEQINVPYFIISHFNKDFGLSLTTLQRKHAKTIISKAKTMFFVSKNNHKFAEHQLAVSIDNYAITANSLNLDNLNICPYPTNLEDTVFVSVARLDITTKDIALQIKCFAEEVWRTRKWKYLIYGSGPDKDYLQDLISYYGLKDKVFLCGFAEDIRAVWNKGHILLQPSIAEGTPLSLQEAMFCGRPAVVTDIAGNTELIKEGINGFVAAGPIYNALSEALERAYLHRHLWEDMGRAGHKSAIKNINTRPEVDLLKALVN